MFRRTIEELEQDAREKLVIDMRSAAEYEKETYPGAVNIDKDDFEQHIAELPKDKPIYLICYTGQKSDEIAETLSDQGYEIYSIDGGYRSWLRIKLERLMEQSEEAERRAADVERSIIKKFRKEIWRKFTRAINEYELIKDGDKIAVCISGGKDSMLMAKLFQELLRHGKKNFELVFLVMNPGYNQLNYDTILNNAKLLEVPITIFKTEIFDIVAGVGNPQGESESAQGSSLDLQGGFLGSSGEPPGSRGAPLGSRGEPLGSPCYLCARMRRGYLYSKAKELGCNKIALGHHYDDVIETILMGMLYGGQMQTMMPKLHSTNFEGMELIRPLYLVREQDIIHWANYNKLHFIQCACRFTESCASCGGTEKGSKRAEIKELIRQLAAKDPVIENNIFRSVENVNLSTVIAYKKDGVKHHFLDTYDD